MLDDQLTLLDGTEVFSLDGARALWPAWADHLIKDKVTPETVLDGVAYYSLDDLRAFVAGST